MTGTIPAPPTAQSLGAQPAFDVLPITRGGTSRTTPEDAFYYLAYRGDTSKTDVNIDTEGQRCGFYITTPETAGTFPADSGLRYGVLISLGTSNMLTNGYRIQAWMCIVDPSRIWVRSRYDDRNWEPWHRYDGVAV